MSIQIEKELKKLRYQVSKLADTIDRRKYPIEYLVVIMNWSEEDLERAFIIFEKHQEQMEITGKLDAGALEKELKDTFEINYQAVKSIIRAFWRNEQFEDTCRAYAEQNEVAEFREILHPVFNNNYQP